MKFDFLSQAAKFLQERKEYKRWLAAFMCLALAVTFGTVGALKMYGQAMTHQVKVLECQYEVHEHTEDCYEKNEDGEPTGDPVCGYADYVIHVHNDDCYDENQNLVCPLEEIEKHEHDDDCYEKKEVLVCEENESESADGHTHTEACYTEVKGELICEVSDDGGHTHDDGCYSETLVCDREEHRHDDSCYKKELVCDNEEEDHEHDDGCYDETLDCDKEEHEHGGDCYSKELTCTEEEGSGHEHTDDCYKTEKELTCEEGESESADGHTHDDECYETEEVLTCGKLELHTYKEALVEDGGCYNESAFDEDGEFIEGSRPVCGIPQLEEHVHTAECFKTVELTGEEVAQLNAGGRLHVHDESCYDADGNLICELPSVHVHGLDCYDEDGNLICGSGWAHTHDESCYDADGNLICGQEETHVHNKDCYDENGNLICGEQEEDHEHDANCYDKDGNLICGYEGVKDHEHSADCYDIKGNLICSYEGVEDHVHSEACYDADGNLICGYEILAVYENSKIFECEDYVVVARYNEDAHIPAEAELLAEKITPETDEEHYAKREAEYQETLGDETASMRALLKIGFYLDGEEDGGKTEIEPETPVEISIQFLDEDGLPEGSPITVVHFADEGTEKLDGSKAKNSSTTFEMKSFSEIAIGYVPEEEQRELTQAVDGTMRLHLADSFEYEDDAFQITFHVEGEAIVPKGSDDAGTEEKAAENAKTEEGGGSEAGEKTPKEPVAEAANKAASLDVILQSREDGTLEEDASEEESGTPEEDASEKEPGTPEEESGIPEEESGEEALEETAEEGKAPKLDFTVEQVARDSEEYQKFKEHATKTDGTDTLLRLQVMSYKLTYGDVELDLSECKVTAEIRPSENLKEQMKKSIPEAAAYLVEHDGEVLAQIDGADTEEDSAVALDEEGTDTEGLTQSLTGENAGAQNHINALSEEGEVMENPTDAPDEDGEDTGAEEGKDAANSEDAGTEETASREDGLTEEVFAEDGESQTGNGEDKAAASTGTESVDLITIQVSTATGETDAPTDEGSLEYDDEGTVGEKDSVTFELSGAMFAVRATGTPNPKFTVQYYANLDILNKTGTNALPVIDTSGRKLPMNGRGTGKSPNANAIKNIYVDSKGKVLTTKTLTEVYKSRNFEYHKAPSINYMNALVKNVNYKLKEVWVLKAGKEPASISPNDWDVHSYSSQLHFTNRKNSATKGYVYIADKAVLRLVYDTTDAKPDIKAAFYDYDISSGHMYTDVTKAKTNDRTGRTETNKQKDGVIYYAYTKAAGINSSGNYTAASGKTKLAFGNVNTGTTMGIELWKGNLLNKYNGDQSSINSNYPVVAGSYQGCTFGLVTGLKDGKIQYASGVVAPKLFNEGSATGKTSYDKEQYSLKFNRVGDTYTLSAVNGTEATGLESFNHPSPYTGKVHTHIWTNDFWPMDSAGSYGAKGHDLKFGSYAQRGYRAFAGSNTNAEPGSTSESKRTYPYSDDGKDHNSYFGMQYAVNFELSEDYVGPLEYYFFGDDDMWVFLDGKLVCDIGGVHSSVGEYVNLWDYLQKGSKGKHTLSFFYTERGASGSTCWMQFTLPSVSDITPETNKDNFANLKVSKKVMLTVDGKDYPAEDMFQSGTEQAGYFADKEFEFKLTIPNLVDDYVYYKYDKDGNAIEDEGGVILWDTIADGETFTLKNGQYIEIQYLPVEAKYTVTEIAANTEIEGVVYKDTDITADDRSGSIQQMKNLSEDLKISGKLPDKNDTSEVEYSNRYYAYALPHTGGSGAEVYAAAGVLILLLGAGFLYRKKFRERRV